MAFMRFILSVALFVAFVPNAVGAADVYVKQNEETGGIILDDQREDDIAPEPQNMEEYSNLFFANCRAQKHPILQGDNLEMFCGCSAAEMINTMSFKDTQTMEKDTQSGELQRNRMLMFVYTPCLAHPARSLIIEQCLAQKETLRDASGTCGCVGDKMSEYILIEAPNIVDRLILTNRLNEDDPMRQLLESQEFAMKNKSYMRHCTAQYEMGQW